jgi:hypothetical protein
MRVDDVIASLTPPCELCFGQLVAQVTQIAARVPRSRSHPMSP